MSANGEHDVANLDENDTISPRVSAKGQVVNDTEDVQPEKSNFERTESELKRRKKIELEKLRSSIDAEVSIYLLDAEEPQEESVDEVEEEEGFVSIFKILDASRVLPEPTDLTCDHLKQISKELGLINLCWPDVQQPDFEERFHFPENYLRNTNKEKLVLLYAESFRRQFHHKYPNRKPLFLAADNECGQQVMFTALVCCTTSALSWGKQFICSNIIKKRFFIIFILLVFFRFGLELYFISFSIVQDIFRVVVVGFATESVIFLFRKNIARKKINTIPSWRPRSTDSIKSVIIHV